MSDALSRPLIWVTGKGGVGKSTLAAALASRLAKQGKKVLLAELGERSSFSRHAGQINVTYEPTPSGFGFDIALWNGTSCLREYVLHYIKVETLYKLFFQNRIMKSFLNVAPAVNELAITGKVTSGQRNVGPPLKYDHIVVDAYASGHTLALLNAPVGMAQAIQSGPMGRESQSIMAVLSDPKVISYVIVALLEELPVIESLELGQELKKITGVMPTVIANRLWQWRTSSGEIQAYKNEGSQTYREFALFLEAQYARQNGAVSRLNEFFSEMWVAPVQWTSDFATLIKELGVDLRKH